jgi:hypothetical protein
MLREECLTLTFWIRCDVYCGSSHSDSGIILSLDLTVDGTEKARLPNRGRPDFRVASEGNEERSTFVQNFDRRPDSYRISTEFYFKDNNIIECEEDLHI